jgi:NAD(P)-dependent dehydrogenase (short-subunit alcohol dehydrogenase family)
MGALTGRQGTVRGMDRYTGKVAVVTGASSGIGRAVALRLGAEGGAVACLDINLEAAEKTAAEIGEGGGRAIAVAVDVSSRDSVRDAIARVVSELGRPNVVCNIAGIGKFHHTLDAPIDEWDRIIAVNLTGTFLVCQATLPHLLENKGVIVNTASTAGVFGQPYSAAYAASKGGVALLTKSLAAEFIETGVRVNAVAPGGIETPLMGHFGFPEGASPKLFDKLMTPFGFAKPEEIAGLFAYLGSDEARYVTGSIYTFDGGMTG